MLNWFKRFKRKRIKSEEVVRAFQETGLKPKRFYFFQREEEKQCACGMGAIYYVLKKSADIEGRVGGFMNSHYGSSYKGGFADGFDGREYRGLDRSSKIGYKDGKNAWRAVVEAGLVEQVK